LNAELSLLWPVIDATSAPLPEAEEWVDRPGKMQFLER